LETILRSFFAIFESSANSLLDDDLTFFGKLGMTNKDNELIRKTIF
jgi:hypothetical protein